MREPTPPRAKPTGGQALRLAELEAEARYASDRYRLYRARVHGPRMTSPARLRALERTSMRTQARLDRARAEQAAPAPRP